MRLVSIPYRLMRRLALVISFALLILMDQMVAQARGGHNAPSFVGPFHLETMRYVEQQFDGVAMVHVPAGCFFFDDPVTGGDTSDIPPHDLLCFSEGYWIDKYEVTNADFARLHGQAAYPSDPKQPRQPRAHITWYEADAFCRLRGGALPDETAWEYAARGPKNSFYPNGNDLRPGTFAGFRPDGTDDVVTNVGSYPASASWVGAQDMIGNVWEWTATKPESNLRTYEESVGDQRAIRGGAVSYSESFDYRVYQTAFRMSADASNEAWDAGFRCVRSEKAGQQIPLATAQFAPDIPLPPDTPTLTSTPNQGTIDPNATPIPAGTSNASWTPLETSFGDFVMDYVPAGCFDMGMDNPADNLIDPELRNESPRHRVCLISPYWFDQYEVTNGQYKRLTGNALSIIADLDLPISPISWNDADAFCKLRGGQLPTEAQWEYAARGPQSWFYPGGDDFDKQQNRNGHHNPNNRSWIGAFDLTDNMMEWVADWYSLDAYQQSAINDPQGPASGAYRVLRGGSYPIYPPRNPPSAYRNFNRPDVPAAEVGIRCVRPVQNATTTASTTARIVPTFTSTSATPTASPSTPIPTLIPVGTANTIWTPITATFKGVKMQRVPAGCFFMGEKPYDGTISIRIPSDHEVCITKPFWIDLTEVSNDTFMSFHGRALYDTRELGGQHPRSYISWDESRTFCIARGGSLPTEAQWEYAARGPESLLFPWGNYNDANNVLAYFEARSRPANVGSKPAGASWIGAMDMMGNVAEWVMDWYDETYVPNSPKDDPPGPEQGTERVVLGGAYYTGPYVESSILDDRTSIPSTDRADWIGFRCILPDSAQPDATPLPSATPAK